MEPTWTFVSFTEAAAKARTMAAKRGGMYSVYSWKDRWGVDPIDRAQAVQDYDPYHPDHYSLWGEERWEDGPQISDEEAREMWRQEHLYPYQDPYRESYEEVGGSAAPGPKQELVYDEENQSWPWNQD